MSFRFLLDTNIISEINKKIPNKLVVDKMNLYQDEVATASVVIPGHPDSDKKMIY
ncbi:MAG: hypothetical protein VKL60_06430 [Sphaerospermopsis sp.]|uniref:hypothetical protein n=1 Tax=Sphaerospermopsis sp. LEGE 00249 TaxID=1380707 RepID=UPI00164D5884|nr:hypothetical protein [Sphaerospermopsis sp. LEGE 00249]MBC5795984.1 hypothetical protein [Sphaerospermopsis sp. LEGE 00249]MEB3148643.1 hypothetical protein [Sphaerospermopsis sp.]